jgi:hypothetical protein
MERLRTRSPLMHGTDISQCAPRHRSSLEDQGQEAWTHDHGYYGGDRGTASAGCAALGGVCSRRVCRRAARRGGGWRAKGRGKPATPPQTRKEHALHERLGQSGRCHTRQIHRHNPHIFWRGASPGPLGKTPASPAELAQFRAQGLEPACPLSGASGGSQGGCVSNVYFTILHTMLMPSSEGERYDTHSCALPPLSHRPGHEG